ncbi:MAG: hypothetical protein KC421_13520 [Anaerolineales bacterium]|nr:hypothetical protein [Anaerolineales bacterium]
MLAQEIITVQLTQEQYQIFINAMQEAKARDMRVAEWTGESAAEIEARYQFPADDIIDDMADAFFAQRTGIAMF